MKKISTLFMSVVLAVCAAFSLVGCGNKGDKIVNDPTTINVRIFKGGYGTTYIEALKEKFEKLYQEEGYKINLLSARADMLSTNLYQDIYSNSGVDVYFGSNIDAQNANKGSYGQILADITESVLNQKPIRFDGTEEDKTVLEKMDVEPYEAKISYDGNYYGIPYAAGTSGMIVNKKLLASYGLELPKTTNELFDCAHEIMKQARKTYVYPFTYSTSGNLYVTGLVFPWLAQYGGSEEYDQFFSMNNADGTPMEKESYKVFELEGVKQAMTSLYEYFDYNMAALGSNAQDYTSAQAQLMRGEAVFYVGGDFFFNEEFYRFPNNRNDVTYIKVPVISSLGTKLFGAGTTYNYNEEKCEQVLRAIIDGADENKEVAQIKSEVDAKLSVSLAEKDVLEVCTARGVIKDSSNGAIALISEKSTKKDIAALFLRMCASTDGGALFAHQANTNSPFAVGVNDDNEYEFIRNVSRVANNRYFKKVTTDISGYRYTLGLTVYFPQMGSNFPNTIIADKVTIFNDKTFAVEKDRSVYATAAAKRIQLLSEHGKTSLEKGDWKPIPGR